MAILKNRKHQLTSANSSMEKGTTHLKQKAEENSHAYTIHTLRANQNKQFEKSVYDKIVEQRLSKLAVSTRSRMAMTFSLDPSIKMGIRKSLFAWYIVFLKVAIFL